MSYFQTFSLGILWVGGLGFVFFAYPESVCRYSGQEATPARVRRIRRIGVVELWIVFLSLFGSFVAGFFTNWPCA